MSVILTSSVCACADFGLKGFFVLLLYVGSLAILFSDLPSPRLISNHIYTISNQALCSRESFVSTWTLKLPIYLVGLLSLRLAGAIEARNYVLIRSMTMGTFNLEPNTL